MKILRRLVMRRPNSDFIQSPSQLCPSVIMSDLELHCANSQMSKVSLEDDGISNPQQIKSYNLSVSVELENGSTSIWPGRFIVVNNEYLPPPLLTGNNWQQARVTRPVVVRSR